MTVINLTEYNSGGYGVTFQNNGCLETFFGESNVCDMTLIAVAFNKSVLDVKTILLEISEKY